MGGGPATSSNSFVNAPAEAGLPVTNGASTPGAIQLAGYFCDNVECGAPGVGAYEPLCTACYTRWYNNPGTRIILENGKRFTPYDLRNYNYPIEDLPEP